MQREQVVRQDEQWACVCIQIKRQSLQFSVIARLCGKTCVYGQHTRPLLLV